jgi:hypothetical protein
MPTTLVPAVQGLGAILLHFTETSLADPSVEAAIITILQHILASRAPVG